MSAEVICPECAAGKHQNCDGLAWDMEQDVQAMCTCQARRHEPPKEPEGPDPNKEYVVTRDVLLAAACTRQPPCGAHTDTVDRMLARLEKTHD